MPGMCGIFCKTQLPVLSPNGLLLVVGHSLLLRTLWRADAISDLSDTPEQSRVPLLQ